MHATAITDVLPIHNHHCKRSCLDDMSRTNQLINDKYESAITFIQCCDNRIVAEGIANAFKSAVAQMV